MITYKKSGVDIDKANKFVNWIKKQIPGIGFFAGFYKIDNKRYLVGTTDGVGTKLKIAQLINKHSTVGIDLVAMNVNDVITCGAKPLFFLDYIACGKIDIKVLKEIMKGIIDGCEQAECKILGGETAELPGMYKENEYDLAGFCCGVVDKDKVITGENISPGDEIIGLYSSGIHSNGYSLIRKVFSLGQQKKFAKVLLTPTKIYVRLILNLLKVFKPNKEIKAIVNITGGGFYDNIIRVLPKNTRAVVYKNLWNVPEIFRIVQKKGNVPEKEMYRTFNMGIGMVIIVDHTVREKVLKIIGNEGAYIGKIEKSKISEVIVI